MDRWAVLGGVLGNRTGECLSGTAVRFHSTPFVFLTDAFTGEVLCGGDVGGGHPCDLRVSDMTKPHRIGGISVSCE